MTNHPNRRKRPMTKRAALAEAALLGAAYDYANGKVPVLTLQNAAVRYRDATDADQKHSAALYAARIAARTPRRSDR